jgi:hypothetical protein
MGEGTTSRGRGVSEFFLKVLALAAMTVNHLGNMYIGVLPQSLDSVLVAVGGLAFPIFGFLVVEGYRHTSNVVRYGIRLLAFAIVSQIPYQLFLGSDLNVMFALFLGLCALVLDDEMTNRSTFGFAVFVLLLAGYFVNWGPQAVLYMLMIKKLWGVTMRPGADKDGPLLARSGAADGEAGPVVNADVRPSAVAIAAPLAMISAINVGLAIASAAEGAASLILTLPYAIVNFAAFVPLRTYNGSRGRPLKWFFYVYYPAHIAVLGLLYLALFGQLPG